MWRKKIKLTFTIFTLVLLTSCGEGLSVKGIVEVDGSNPVSACPAPLSLKTTFTKSKLIPTPNFISNKIQITKTQLQNQNDQIKLNLKIDKQCASFLKLSDLSQKIINTSSTLDIESLNQQNYASSIKKSKFIDFQKQVEKDYCIKQVNIESTFKLIQPLNLTEGLLEITDTQQSTTVKKLNTNKATQPHEDFNDPFLFRQSHLWGTSAFDAFKKFYDTTYGLQSTDSKSIVAIVDSPIYRSHEDLQNLVLNTSINPISASLDKNHGTHIAGLIAANTNNNLGTIGIASQSVKLISVGVVSADRLINGQIEQTITSGDLSNKLEEIIRLPSNLKPAVVNLSLELGTVNCQDHADTSIAIKRLLDSGISIVVAAGNGVKNTETGMNEGQNFNPVSFLKYPACLSKTTGFEGLITVGSVHIGANNTILRKSEFSNYSSEYINIAAPGSSSLGGLYSTVSSAKNYNWKAGTSMSTPLVTAAVALSYSVLKKTRRQINNKNIFTKCNISDLNKPKVIKDLILKSAIKRSAFSTYWKDGNVLNYLNLINRIQLVFPDTKTN